MCGNKNESANGCSDGLQDCSDGAMSRCPAVPREPYWSVEFCFCSGPPNFYVLRMFPTAFTSDVALCAILF